jgi:hypothetical protein
LSIEGIDVYAAVWVAWTLDCWIFFLCEKRKTWLLLFYFIYFAVKNKDIFVRMAKRVRDAEGGVSQCGEQRSTKRSEARSSPTRRETPK